MQCFYFNANLLQVQIVLDVQILKCPNVKYIHIKKIQIFAGIIKRFTFILGDWDHCRHFEIIRSKTMNNHRINYNMLASTQAHKLGNIISDFQWKFIHMVLPTNKFLFQCQLIDCADCSLCTNFKMPKCHCILG